MSEVVLDASVVLRWFRDSNSTTEASRIRSRFAAGELRVVTPHLLLLEILNVAGRRWGWNLGALVGLATALQAAGFEEADPDLAGVAEWIAKGLTAYDATYVALAVERGIPLVTEDGAIISVAPEFARPPQAI